MRVARPAIDVAGASLAAKAGVLRDCVMYVKLSSTTGLGALVGYSFRVHAIDGAFCVDGCMQGLISLKGFSQAGAPFVGTCLMMRSRDCTELMPHVAEHDPQLPQYCTH